MATVRNARARTPPHATPSSAVGQMLIDSSKPPTSRALTTLPTCRTVAQPLALRLVPCRCSPTRAASYKPRTRGSSALLMSEVRLRSRLLSMAL